MQYPRQHRYTRVIFRYQDRKNCALFCSILLSSILLFLCVAVPVLRADRGDSLRHVIAQYRYDTNTVKALNDYAFMLHESYPDSTRQLATSALALSDSLHYADGMSQSLNIIGISYYIQTNYEKALEYYFRTLRIRESMRNARLIAGTLNNIGMVYQEMKQHDESLQYFRRAAHVNDSINYFPFLARNYANISTTFEAMRQLDSALIYQFRSLAIKERINDRPFIASSLRSIGHIYLRQKNYAEAERYLARAQAMPEASKQTQAQALLDKSEIQQYRGALREAIVSGERALQYAVELRSSLLEQQANELLSRYYLQAQNIEQSNIYYARSIAIRDSLFNEQATRQVGSLRTNFEIAHRQDEIEILLKENQLQNTIRNAFIGGIILLAGLLSVAVWGYRTKRDLAVQLEQTNIEILRQSHQLEAQSQEISRAYLDLEQSNTQLLTANDRLRVLDEEKNEFLGIVAHDLKNPLTSILGLSEILLMQQPTGESESDAQHKIFLEHIVAASNRMFNLINNLLDINALESGKINLAWGDTNIGTLVESITAHYHRPAADKHIVLHTQIPAEPIIAWTDSTILHQILDNLVSNAVKYSPAYKHVFVRLQVVHNRDHDMVRIEVKDEGPGLSVEDQKRLFGKFARLSAQPTGGEHSTGLGLSIVKKITEAISGNVWCESQLGDGAMFVVEIPVRGVVGQNA